MAVTYDGLGGLAVHSDASGELSISIDSMNNAQASRGTDIAPWAGRFEFLTATLPPNETSTQFPSPAEYVLLRQVSFSILSRPPPLLHCRPVRDFVTLGRL